MRRLEYAELNMGLVAAGVRPGWLADFTTAAALRRRAARLGLAAAGLRFTDVKVRGLKGSVLVTADEGGAAPPPAAVQTHESVARHLGLPCGSASGASDPSQCHAFIVEAVPAAECRAEHRLYITSFWCRSRAQGVAWCKRFKRAARAYEREELRPRGLRLLFRSDSPLAI